MLERVTGCLHSPETKSFAELHAIPGMHIEASSSSPSLSPFFATLPRQESCGNVERSTVSPSFRLNEPSRFCVFDPGVPSDGAMLRTVHSYPDFICTCKTPSTSDAFSTQQICVASAGEHRAHSPARKTHSHNRVARKFDMPVSLQIGRVASATR